MDKVIREQEKALFDEIKKTYPSCIVDGVVDTTEYKSARYKILYVLKEANGGDRWNLTEFLFIGGRPQTWNNVARWTEGILFWEKDISWDELEVKNDERRDCFLKMIAVVNLKKTSGDCVSDGKVIYDAAMENKEIIKKQVDLYVPDIIICGGTGDSFCEAIYGKDYRWESTRHGIPYMKRDGRIIISYAHPEARVANSVLYYGLMDAVKEIMSE